MEPETAFLTGSQLLLLLLIERHMGLQNPRAQDPLKAGVCQGYDVIDIFLS